MFSARSPELSLQSGLLIPLATKFSFAQIRGRLDVLGRDWIVVAEFAGGIVLVSTRGSPRLVLSIGLNFWVGLVLNVFRVIFGEVEKMIFHCVRVTSCVANAPALCLGLLVWLMCCSGQVAASPIEGAQYITDKQIIDIAIRTLGGGEDISVIGRNKVEKRGVEVRAWLESMGGGNWYRNYLKRFGSPISVEELKTATLIGLFDNGLGYYYIRRLPASVKSMTILSCEVSTNDRQVFMNFENNPTAKAQCALANFDASLAFNDQNSLKEFRVRASWFLQNHVDGRWEWGFDLPSRGLKAPWVSALTQSQGISVLLREYQLSGDSRYLNAARKALGWMKRPIEEGGLSKRMRQGVFYEEYPSVEKPSHVLNGHIWALFGIWDFYRVTKDADAKKMFDEGVRALRAELPKYDVDCWSVYSQDNRLDSVTGAYQQFIVEQLRVIYAITSDKFFHAYAEKWSKCLVEDELFTRIAARDFMKANPRLRN